MCIRDRVVDDLPLAQEAYDIAYVGVIAEAKNVVIGHTGLLLRGHILREVGNHVAFDPYSCLLYTSRCV